MINKIAKNIKSPKNESALIEEYKKANPRAKKPDNLDIAAVKTKSGEIGHPDFQKKFLKLVLY